MPILCQKHASQICRELKWPFSVWTLIWTSGFKLNSWSQRQVAKAGPNWPKVDDGRPTQWPYSLRIAVRCLFCLSKQPNRVQRDVKNRKIQTSNSGFDAFVIETHLLHRSLRHSSQIYIVLFADTKAVSMLGHSRRAAASGNLTVLRRWSGVISLQSWHLNIVVLSLGWILGINADPLVVAWKSQLRQVVVFHAQACGV